MELNEMQAAQLDWNDSFVLGFGPMDAIHREFVDLVAAVQLAPDEELVDRLAALATHCQQHFEEENRWMIETDFPPRDCHIDEHNAVLQSVRDVQALLAQGDIDNCRRLTEALAGWFPGHADHLDSALAHWMCKRRFGGKPVVFRRDPVAKPGGEPGHGA
jgi:hemerythrin-like metal-binding protein